MTDERVPVYKKKCPICGRPTIDAYSIGEDIKTKKSALWYNCGCGVIFQSDPPKPVPKDAEYLKRYENIKEYDEIADYSAHMYCPIIEELTYGRKMLDVGFATHNNMEYFKKRGWVAYGIENNIDTKETRRIIKGDFETTDQLYQKHFDLVWMSFVLERFLDPISALKKAHSILQEDGVLYIDTPDIGFLTTEPRSRWSHWKMDEVYIFWSARALCRELEKLGFEIIVKRRNYYRRFGYTYNVQIIAQKIFF